MSTDPGFKPHDMLRVVWTSTRYQANISVMTDEIDELRSRVAALDTKVTELALQNLRLVNVLTIMLPGTQISSTLAVIGNEPVSVTLDNIFDEVYRVGTGEDASK